MGCQRLCSFSWRVDPCRRRSRRPARPPANICPWDGDICSGVPCLRSCDVCRMVDRRSQRIRHRSSATCAPKPCHYRSSLSEDNLRTRYRYLGRGIGNHDLPGPGPWRLSDRCAPLARGDQPASGGSVIVLALRYVPESRNDMVSGSLDWLGGLLVVVAFGSLAAGLTFVSDTSAPTRWKSRHFVLAPSLRSCSFFTKLRRPAP